MPSSPKNSENSKDSFLVALVRSSIILSSLDRFTKYIYTLLQNGFFGFLFTGYNSSWKSTLSERYSKTKFAAHEREFRYGTCRRIESSVIIAGVSYIMKFLLCCRLKVFGAFLSSFGLYTAVIAFIGAVIHNNLAGLPDNSSVLFAVALIISSIPLIMSKKRLSEALVSSNIGRFVLKVTGYSESEISETVGDGGHINSAFLVGIICSALTYNISPFLIFGAIVVMIAAYLILVRPELGVLALFFFMPWLPTMVLAALVIYTSICYFIKLFRGKRIFVLEPVDIMVTAFALMLFFGGFISLSSSSIKPSLLMICLLCAYYLTVELIVTRSWLIKCSVACVTSAVFESLYGIFLYFTGGGYSSQAWLDSEMFTSIGGRAVGSLENPNMLGEYLILIIPVAFAMLIGRGEGMRRTSAFVSLGIMGSCLILTWSRGAWLGLMLAVVVMMFMWHSRSLWLVFAGIISLPFLPSVLPQSIIGRFTSIGNLSDSSTSYRVHIWHATVNMIKDNVWSGIGIGEGAWNRLYPLYTFMGVEAAPHSHNLYLQIWLELGLFGLLTFAAFIFMLYSSGFTLFSRLSDPSVTLRSELTEDLFIDAGKQDCHSGFSVAGSKTQLRLSCAGPLCGIIAVLAQGMTDYTWYNYRLYLMFWLICGLASAYIRNGRAMIEAECDVPENKNSGYREIMLDTSKRKNKRQTERHGQK